MRVLISGAGIAGPTLAYWLAHYGLEPTLIETAPSLRTGGYVIDFWGAGFDIADRMGALPEIRRQGYIIREVRVVDRNDKRVAGFPVEAFARMTQGRYVSLPRGELGALPAGHMLALERALPHDVEALEDSAFLLTIAWPEDATKV